VGPRAASGPLNGATSAMVSGEPPAAGELAAAAGVLLLPAAAPVAAGLDVLLLLPLLHAVTVAAPSAAVIAMAASQPRRLCPAGDLLNFIYLSTVRI